MDSSLKSSAKCITKLFASIIICALFVVANIESSRGVNSKQNVLPLHQISTKPSAELWNALANSILLLTLIIGATILLALLYLKGCYKFLQSWLILATILMLFVVNYFSFSTFLKAYNIPMDYPTALLIIWNFGIAGMLAIHWNAPLRMQQVYLLFVAALIALLFIRSLSESAIWLVLATVSVWDLVAVLSNKGPLRILVETAHQRDEHMLPALIYSTTTVYVAMAAEATNLSTSTEVGDSQTVESIPLTSLKRRRNGATIELYTQSTTSHDGQTAQEANTTINEFQSPLDIKLGLGDFIFYAVLIGEASVSSDLFVAIACLIAILFGLFLTCLILAIWYKALPALPISIAFGLFVYFASKFFLEPFMANILAESILI